MKREIDAVAMDKVYEVVAVNYLENVYDEVDGEVETSLELIRETKQILALLHNLGLINKKYMDSMLDMVQEDIVMKHKVLIEEFLYDEMFHTINETTDTYKL